MHGGSSSPDWITPACAGKTLRRCIQGLRLTDHPRMRGEDDVPDLSDLEDEGSPPHARGRHVDLIFPYPS